MVRAAIRTISPFGRTLLVTTAMCWVVGARFGWREMSTMAAALLVLLVLGIVFTIGRLELGSSLRVEPSRVVVGERAAGALTITNRRKRAARSLRIELPVGAAAAVFPVPHLGAGADVEELFVVPTNRRAVIPVGPVASVQGDALGLFRRKREWSHVEEIYVHPETVVLSTLAAGLLRDLEGQTTRHLSPSDVAFHTLRDYVPGDDRRHVHWKSSAKLNKLMVRQYVDTRRSHIAVALSLDLDEYASADEFELAVSCAASVALQAARDEQTLSMFAGDQQLPTVNPKHMLDRFSALEARPGGTGIDECLTLARRSAPDASVAVVCLGSRLSVPDIRRAATRISLNTTTVVLRAALGTEPNYRAVGQSRFVTVPDLTHLNRGLEAVL